MDPNMPTNGDTWMIRHWHTNKYNKFYIKNYYTAKKSHSDTAPYDATAAQ